MNFFQPSFKLAEKKRVGAHVTKRYHAPETRCGRLLQSDAVPEATKERLSAIAITLDLLRILDEIRTVQHELAGIAAGRPLRVDPHRDADLDQFMKGLATAWHGGEVRPTHQSKPKPPRHWRTHKDAFEAVWPRVLAWLQEEPDRTGSELLVRLQAERPGEFPDAQLRTFQRRLKVWRRAAARRLVFTPDIAGAESAVSMMN